MSYVAGATIFLLVWLLVFCWGKYRGWPQSRIHLISVSSGAVALAVWIAWPLLLGGGDSASLNSTGPSSVVAAAPQKSLDRGDRAIFEHASVRVQKSVEHKNLVASALTSPERAYKLSESLMRCSQLDRLLEEHSSLSSRLSDNQLESASAQLDLLASECEPFVGMDSRTGYELAHYAASTGLLEAQIYFPALVAPYITSSEQNSLDQELLRKYKSDSVRFAVEAAATGDAGALFHAYGVFSDGLFVEPNPKQAHRYLSEYLKRKSSPALELELERLSSEIRSGG